MDIKITQQITEVLNLEITALITELEAQYNHNPVAVEMIESLVAKAAKLGAQYERQTWQSNTADTQSNCIHVWRLKQEVQVCAFCGIALHSAVKQPLLKIVR